MRGACGSPDLQAEVVEARENEGQHGSRVKVPRDVGEEK